jgi:metal-responsive CopG/Arc/MetJ family transcriptional regulator
MKMERVIIQLPTPLKAKLNALRKRGYTASGYIRSLLEKDLAETKPQKKGR